MKLSTLLNNLNYISISNQSEIDIKGIACSSKCVKKRYIFVAIAGTKLDGHNFIDEAIERRAAAVVVSNSVSTLTRYSVSPQKNKSRQVIFIRVPDSRRALSQLCDKFYGHPSQYLKLIGITGTNGKTTVSYLVDAILNKAGYKVGLIGTISYRIGNRLILATNTTPGPIELHSFLYKMVSEKSEYAVMEVSSHSLDQRRVDFLDFDVGIFTNLTKDHLDYHKSVDKYFEAKATLFKNLSSHSRAIINIDDQYGKELIKNIKAKVITYGIKEKADIRASELNSTLKGTEILVSTPKGNINIETSLLGIHNVYNILSSIGVGLSEGIDFDTIKYGIKDLTHIPGRLEVVDCGQPFKIFIDYAHTEDALRNILITLRNLTNGGIILVFGCGGDRDRDKRPKMGTVAGELAKFVILTSDNPRSEDPQKIVCDILDGINGNHYTVILDRFKAIKEALFMATAEDIVVIAGKGHEAYQIFKDSTVPFDDKEVVKKILKKDSLRESNNSNRIFEL